MPEPICHLFCFRFSQKQILVLRIWFWLLRNGIKYFKLVSSFGFLKTHSGRSILHGLYGLCLLPYTLMFVVYIRYTTLYLHKVIFHRSQKCFIHLYKFVSYGRLVQLSTLLRRRGTGGIILVLLGGIVPKGKTFSSQEFLNSFWVLCLHVLKSSFLLFKEAESGLNGM